MQSADLAAANLLDLSLEQLGDIEVTSVTRRPERLQDAAASIFVISAEDIRSSGAANLPELRARARYIQVSGAGQKEAAPHDVVEVTTRKG